MAGVAYVYRAHPLLQSMRAAIRSGRLGRPLEIVAVSGQDFPFYRPAYREIYYRQRETGGGAVQDALTHVVNAGEWLVGPVTALAADAAHLKLPGVEVEDTVHVIARHGAVMASYSLNQHQPANENTITAICEKGLARFEFHRQRWLSQAEPDADRQVEETCTLGRDDLFIRQANSFLDAVEGKGAVLCSLDEAIQTLRVNLAILESAETRTWQTIG